MKILSKAIFFILLLTSSLPLVTHAGENEVRQALKTLIPSQQPTQIKASHIPNWYEATYGASIFYVSHDGRYVMQGDIYDTTSETNITEQTRSTYRRTVLQRMDVANMIVFKPKKTRYAVTVFSDIDCGYCRKMHSQIDQYLALGIEIRYVLFPRSGMNTDSYYKAVSVFCSSDRQSALTMAKQGIVMPNKTCKNPVEENIHIADSLGISGTPTLLFDSGKSLPGYVPAKELLRLLNKAG